MVHTMTIRLFAVRRSREWFAAALLALFCLVPLRSGRAATVAHAEHVTLTASLQRVAKSGATDWVALHFTIAPGWHIYWKNPGETGLPSRVAWTLPAGISAGAIGWPLPERFVTGGLVNYGFTREVTLVVPLAVARGAVIVGKAARADVSWLLCAQMCIPESATLAFPLSAAFGDASVFPKALAALPKPFPGTASFSAAPNSIILRLSAVLLAGVDPDAIHFFPATRRAVDDAIPPRLQRSGDSLQVTFVRSRHSHPVDAFGGVLDAGPAGVYRVTAKPSPQAKPPAVPAPAAAVSGFWVAAFFAFLGGLILNLMPCVLPILSMKALTLAQSGEDVRAMRRDGAFFFTGVLLSFVTMAAALIALKAAGAEIGWGFQLQSPLVIAGLLLLTSAIGLNLLGAFEIPLGVTGFGSRLTEGGSRAGAFFTGVLAVLVASPCTAPFMGTALGYALTAPALIAIAVFLALGIGFAAPFTALAFIPGIARLIPRPGPWMVRFKELLAFPMFATSLWLLWVLAQETGTGGLALVLGCALGLVFLFWLLRLVSTAARWGVGIAGGAAIAALLTIGLAATPASISAANGSAWAPWSEQAVEAARQSGHPVLVDLGASWCVTCLVNERIALDNPDVERRLARDRVVTLKGDWTNRDPAIAALLTRYGRDGVPLYLLYPANASAPARVLPQILTPGAVLEALGTMKR